MSKELVKFKKSHKDFVQYNAELALELSKSNLNLVLQIMVGPCNFSESPWVTLDNKTLAGFKAFAIYDKIGKKLIPIFYPGINPEPGKPTIIPFPQLLSPRKLNPQQLSEALDSIKEITENMLHETMINRTGFEIIWNFLKSCLNFLITIVTFGQKQNFFKSSTFYLEKINQIQQDLHNIFGKLSEEEKIAELDGPPSNRWVTVLSPQG